MLAQAHDLLGVGVIADRQLAGRDDALGLEADVEQDLVAIDLDDRALDQVTIVELDDGVGHHVFERRSTEVVFGDGAGDVIPLRIEGPHRFGGQLCKEGGCALVGHGGTAHFRVDIDRAGITESIRSLATSASRCRGYHRALSGPLRVPPNGHSVRTRGQASTAFGVGPRVAPGHRDLERQGEVDGMGEGVFGHGPDGGLFTLGHVDDDLVVDLEHQPAGEAG